MNRLNEIRANEGPTASTSGTNEEGSNDARKGPTEENRVDTILNDVFQVRLFFKPLDRTTS